MATRGVAGCLSEQACCHGNGVNGAAIRAAAGAQAACTTTSVSRVRLEGRLRARYEVGIGSSDTAAAWLGAWLCVNTAASPASMRSV